MPIIDPPMVNDGSFSPLPGSSSLEVPLNHSGNDA